MGIGQHLSSVNPAFLKDEERWVNVKIKDIPILFNTRGEIVCIPREDEVFAAAICGSSGNGKTLLANRLVSGLYFQWNSNVAIMNDYSEETYKWSEPMKCKHFNETNDYYLNQKPIASPIVYLYQNTNDLQVALKSNSAKYYIKTVLPFDEIMEDIGFYLNGVSPDFDLGKSEMYVNKLKEELKECKTPTQVRDCLRENLPGADGKTFQGMRIKILTAFDRLLEEEILDITNVECRSYLRLKEPKFRSNPFSTLMKAKLIPSFITSGLATKKYRSAIFSYYINSIFRNNLKDFPGEKTFLYFDELTTVCTKDGEPSAIAMGNVAARGRINNVGLIYTTQFYDKIPNCVKGAKLNYCFAFAHNSSKIITEISRDFDLDKKLRLKMQKLKEFEVIALTNNKFICYRNGEPYETREPQVGKIFFPLANHKKAGTKK